MLVQALSVNLTIYHYTSEMLMTFVMAWATLPSDNSENRERLPIWTYSASDTFAGKGARNGERYSAYPESIHSGVLC